MAIAEARVGVLTKVATVERTKPLAAPKEFVPIEVSREEMKKLALMHFDLSSRIKGVDLSRMDDEQARVFGTAEIQAQVLTMLGQEHLLDLKKPPTYEDIVKPRLIREEQIRILTDRYRKARISCLENNIFIRSTNKHVDLKPWEVIVQAQADELSRMLVQFGQEKLVVSIDREIPWGQMISTGNGELQ